MDYKQYYDIIGADSNFLLHSLLLLLNKLKKNEEELKNFKSTFLKPTAYYMCSRAHTALVLY